MPSSNENKRLMFQPYSSILNPGFWQQLTSIKLNKLKLSKDPIDLHGSYSCNLSNNLPCLASFDHSSFNEQAQSSSKSSCQLHGQLICLNIMQEFLDFKKKELLDAHGADIWQSIFDGRAINDPEKYLSKFGLLVFADLKKYIFYYWFFFPAINYPKEVYLTKQADQNITNGDSLNASDKHKPILEVFSEQAVKTLQNEYDKSSVDRDFQRGYFIVKHFIDTLTGSDGVSVYPLTRYKDATQEHDNQMDSQIYFTYTDPSASQVFAGWPLRNFICLIAVQFELDHIKVLRIRKGQPSKESRLELHHSMILEVNYQLNPTYTAQKPTPEAPLITGWEKNESQQVAPKRVNLSSLLDPKKLAEDAVNLNLRLMKWRLLPTLDLEKIAGTKCLLLGCGTLGCHIARGLLAWGIKNISIVDNAKISYSNPVRQTLYNFDDCTNTKFKAEAAAASLRKIHPSVIVKPYVFSIPMPGHHVVDKEIDQTKKDIELLETLIGENDVTFLLMDTRESRWLPTVIAMSKQKLVINVAIGFDTFLLQRHGIRNYNSCCIPNQSSSETSTEVSSDPKPNVQPSQLSADKLGCYFCSDIVGPADSTSDRTLDQQCTVSRPGVSMMVSAMAVELLASIMSSSAGPLTPAPLQVTNELSLADEEDCGSELGIVPHSIRGNIDRFHIYRPTSHSFDKCSACSSAVVNAYLESRHKFLYKVFDDPSYLEEVAGLKDMQSFNPNVLAFGDDEDFSDFRESE